MSDPRWPRRLELARRPVLAEKLAGELEALPGLKPAPDELGNPQAGVRLSIDDASIVVEYRDGADAAAIRTTVEAHDPTPAPPPPARTGAAIVADLRTNLQNWATLSPADKDVHLRKLTRAVLALADIVQTRDA